MSISEGGTSISHTVNEQNPITATDNAIVASEGSIINITDGRAFDVVKVTAGGAFDVVKDAIISNEKVTESSIEAGLDYFGQATDSILSTIDKVFEFAGETVSKSQDTIASSSQAIFNSAISDELNKSQDLNATVRELAKWAVVGVVGFAAFKYAFK